MISVQMPIFISCFPQFFLQFHQSIVLLTIKSLPKGFNQNIFPHQSALIVLAAFHWLLLWLSQSFCLPLYALHGISNKVSFCRNNELPDVNKWSGEYWDLCTIIKLGQMWMSFSSQWLSSHFSKRWQNKPFIVKQLL